MRLIFAITPRCGSTAMARAINWGTRTYFNMCIEPFNKDCEFTGWHHEWDVTWNNFKSSEYGGLKHLSYQGTEQQNKFLISECTHTILLYRENLVECSASEWMSVSYREKTGRNLWEVWKHTDTSKFPDFWDMVRDPIPDWYFATRKGEVENMISELRKIDNTMLVKYEDLFGEETSDSEYHRVCDFMGLEVVSDCWKEFLAPKNKFNKGDVKYKLIPNLNEYKDRQEEFYINVQN